MKTPTSIGLKLPGIILFLFFSFLSYGQVSETKAQKPKSKSNIVGIASAIKDTGNHEEPPAPPPPFPPPSVEMKQVFSDTSAGGWESATFRPDTSAAPDDKLTVEIKRMLKLTDALNTGLRAAATGLQALNLDPSTPDEFVDRFISEISSDHFKRIFENTIINIYRKHLTVEDVMRLNEFYESDLGKKVISLMPVIIQECTVAGSSLGENLGEKIYSDLVNEGKIK